MRLGSLCRGKLLIKEERTPGPIFAAQPALLVICVRRSAMRSPPLHIVQSSTFNGKVYDSYLPYVIVSDNAMDDKLRMVWRKLVESFFRMLTCPPMPFAYLAFTLLIS